MLIKFVGIVLVISGFGGWGISGARRLRRRVKQLQGLRQAFGYLEKEITGLYSPLTSALENTARFADEPVAELFSESAALLRKRRGLTAGEAWRKGVQKMNAIGDLNELDIDLLNSAAGQIGVSDARQQKKFLAFIQEQLKISEEKARLDLESGQKMYLYGGFIIGSLVVLLFI